jgi:sarcosine oxidase subunit gamma
MLNPVSALNGAKYTGFSRIREIGPLGMISLRAKPDVAGLDAAILAATGCARPDLRQIVHNGANAAGWMSPDEYLLIMPYGDTGAAIAAIETALAGQHFLAVTVSDARAVFQIDGAGSAVLSKLAPVDFDNMGPFELRRTRTAQVAAAFWRSGADGFTLVCFRSVAAYFMGLLTHSAMPGSEIN